MKNRKASVHRSTNETRVRLKLDLDGQGRASIGTGMPFFDHMLTLFAKHAVVDLKLRCQGDLEVDAHHTVEDCGIALGQAFAQALGDKRGIRRYGAGFRSHETRLPARPMCRWMNALRGASLISADGLSWSGAGLNAFAYKNVDKAERSQDMSSAFRFGLAREFFQAFANEARCNLHLELLYGDEPHHIVEALFKAFAKAVDAACRRDPRIAGRLPSTKGKL